MRANMQILLFGLLWLAFLLMIVTVAFRLWCLSLGCCFPLVVSQRGLLLSACVVSAWVVAFRLCYLSFPLVVSQRGLLLSACGVSAFRLWCLSVGCCFPLVVSQLSACGVSAWLLLSACGVSAWVVAFRLCYLSFPLVVSQRGLLLSACGVSAFRLWCLSVGCCFPLVVSQRGCCFPLVVSQRGCCFPLVVSQLSACGVSAWVVAFRLWCLSVGCLKFLATPVFMLEVLAFFVCVCFFSSFFYKYVFIIIIIIISSNEVSSTGKALHVHARNQRESCSLLSRPAPSLAVWLSLFSVGRVFAGFRTGRRH